MTPTHLTAPALAEQAAEAVRMLNHRTIGDILPIDEAYAVLGELSSLCHRLDQLASQLGRGLHHRQTGPGYRLDLDGQTRWPDPATAVAAAVDALDQAATIASRLGDLICTGPPGRRPRHRQPTRHGEPAMTSNRRRRHSRYTPPSNRYRRPEHPPDGPPVLYVVGWYDPDGNEIETVIDLNDPTADQTLVDLIHLMTDNCPHCNGHHQEGDHHGRD